MTRTDGTHRQTKIGCTACGNYEAHAPLCPNRSKPMTRAEALAEAQRRWGRTARVFKSVTGLRYVYSENTVNAEGVGHSWEAAFADADKREAFRKATAEGRAHFFPGGHDPHAPTEADRRVLQADADRRAK